MSSLKGKVALVTGGSRGIGAAIAKRLADDGANVALTYSGSEAKAHQVVADIQAKGRKGLAIRADAADPAAVTASVEQTVATLGRIDILVNNAGIFIVNSSLEAPLEDYERTMAVNVRAVFVASQAAARRMGEGGRIINIGSNLSDRVPGPGVAIYAMSKSALTGLTKGMARDLGPRGITVNLVNPGPTDTDMNPADGPRADFMRGLMAIPRYGTGENVAALVAYVASEEGRSVNGAALLVDGGINA